MKHVEGVEAAIHCVTTLGGLRDGAVLPAAALAEAFGLSQTYLVKTLKTLVSDGLLTSVPGPAGGYRLARRAEEITLLDVVLAVNGPEPAFRCQNIRRNGPCAGLPGTAFARPCGVNRAMLAAEKLYRDALSQTTIAALIGDHQATSDPRSRASFEGFITDKVRPNVAAR